MLRTNLSTRPFYNERAAHLAIALAGVIVLAITVFNVVTIVSLSRHNTELSSRIGADNAEAERLTAEAARIRRTINKDDLELVVAAAEEANALIDQRTFSWTKFFNEIESTLPPDVMLTSVRPTVREGITHVTMGVLGKRAEDVDEFMEKLEATGAFEDVVPAQQDRTDEGLYRVVIPSVYIPILEEEAPAETPPAVEPAKPSAPASDPAPRRPPGRGRQ
jgi:hypothetical protein